MKQIWFVWIIGLIPLGAEQVVDPALVEMAIQKGVTYLEALPKPSKADLEKEQEEAEIFFSPPARQRVKVGDKSVTYRYRMESVERPKYEWTTKEVMVRREGSSEQEAGMVKKEVRVRGPQIGTEMVKIPRKDPNGPLTRTVKIPVYERNGPDRWRIGQLAANSMAALVLLRQEEAVVPDRLQEMLDELSQLVEDFGPPETTMDLAWLIILFSESGDETCRQLVPELIQRLVNAQLREGPGRGLWGPVAADPEELAVWMEEVARLTELFDEQKAKIGERGSRTELQKLNSLQEQLVQANTQLDRLAASYRDPKPRRSKHERETEHGEAISFTAPDEYLFNQRTADIEQTWLALYALRTAREYRLLPGTVTRTARIPGRGGVRKETVSVVQALNIAGRAIVSNQHASGAFPEMNIQQPVKAFDLLEGIPGVPVDIRSFEPLPSPITLISTAQGLSALDQIRHILGVQAMRPYAKSMLGAKKLLDDQMDRVLAGEVDRLGEHPLGVFALCLALRDTGPDMALAPRELLKESAGHLLSIQMKSGDWRRPMPDRVWVPGVWRVRSKQLPRAPGSLSDPGLLKPFTILPLKETETTWDWRYRQAYEGAYPVIGTAAALLTLQAMEDHRMAKLP